MPEFISSSRSQDHRETLVALQLVLESGGTCSADNREHHKFIVYKCYRDFLVSNLAAKKLLRSIAVIHSQFFAFSDLYLL